MNIVPFTIYDPETGRIIATGNCAESDIESQAVPPGHAITSLVAGVLGMHKVVIVEGDPTLEMLSAEERAAFWAGF